MTLEPGLLLAVERAVDRGATLLRQGRSHFGSVIPKGDRDYATEVDVRIEETIRAALSELAPGIPFLGEEEGGGDPADSEARPPPDRRARAFSACNTVDSAVSLPARAPIIPA